MMRFLARRVVPIEKRGEALVGRRILSRAVARDEELVFVRRARFEDADEMLERPLSGGDRFGRADGVRHVAFELDAALLRLVRDREIGVARDARLNLDEVDAAAP